MLRIDIFTKDLLLSSSLGKENEGEYLEMLSNLVACLNPQNQMESLLVEKIAIDFWRLRRVIRFETGSIGRYLETVFKEFYSLDRKDNEKLDREIKENKDYIDWVETYLEHLKKDAVSFDNSVWKGKGIEGS